MSTEEDIELADYGLLDQSNPRSLINIVPPEVAEAIKRVPRELLLMDEKELKRKVKPTETVNYVRLNFWLEYNRAQEKRSRMMATNIIRGACHKDYFYEGILKHDLKLAWVLTPPADYAVIQADLFEQSLEKLRGCLQIRPYTIKITEKTDKEGNKVVTKTRVPNVGAIKEIREITRMLSDRIQGAVVQRVAIKQHSVNENHQLTGPQTYDVDALERLNAQLGAVNQTLAALEAAPAQEDAVLDAEVTDAGS